MNLQVRPYGPVVLRPLRRIRPMKPPSPTANGPGVAVIVGVPSSAGAAPCESHCSPGSIPIALRTAAGPPTPVMDCPRPDQHCAASEWSCSLGGCPSQFGHLDFSHHVHPRATSCVSTSLGTTWQPRHASSARSSGVYPRSTTGRVTSSAHRAEPLWSSRRIGPRDVRSMNRGQVCHWPCR